MVKLRQLALSEANKITKYWIIIIQISFFLFSYYIKSFSNLHYYQRIKISKIIDWISYGHLG